MKEAIVCTVAALGLAYLAIDYKYVRPRRTKQQVRRFLGVVRQSVYTPPRNGYVASYGVVMTAGSIDANLFMAVAGVRQSGCSLPITIYTTVAPTNAHVALLQRHQNVSIVYRRSELIKLVALIESPYENVILIDHDCMCIQNPTTLLNGHKFIDTGLLLWRATPRRAVLPSRGVEWIRSAIPYRRRHNALLLGTSSVQTNGVITLLNKATHQRTLGVLLAFLSAWRDNELRLQETLSTNVEDLIWVAAEIANEPYAFSSVLPGCIGAKFGSSVRGVAAYFDDFHNLVAAYDADGNMYENYRSTDFQHYIRDDSVEGRYSADLFDVSADVQDLFDWYYKSYVAYLASVAPLQTRTG